MHILVVLTYGVSFKIWKNNGLLERELLIYEKLQKEKNVKFTFLSFGDIEDKELVKNFDVVPFFEFYSEEDNKFLNLLRSILFPLKLKKIIETPDIIKTNQLMGSWIAIVYKIFYSKPIIVRTGYDIFRFYARREDNTKDKTDRN